MESSPGSSRRFAALAAAALVAASGALAYCRTFAVPFVFDDLYTIANNPSLRHWATAFRPPLESTTAGRPFLNFTFAINYAVGQTSVWGYHAVNLSIHVLAALVLFGIVRRTVGRTDLACGAALLWVVHPLDTESVTYIVQRAESLGGLFYLLTLYCFIRWRVPRSSRPGWIVLSVVFCLIGMTTKEVMVSAPLVVLLYDRTFVAGTFREAWRRSRAAYLALAATWIPLVLLVLFDRGRNGTAGFNAGVVWWRYALTQFVAITHYLCLCFWPHPLVFDYGIAAARLSPRLILPILLVSGLVAATLWALWNRPRLGFLGAAFFLVLAPSSSVVPVASQIMAEHRMYLPLAAVAVLAALLLYRGLRHAAFPVCLVLVGVLLALTWRRNDVYRSPQALWLDTVANAPANPRAHEALGNLWLNSPGRLQDAIAEYRESLRLYPDNPRVRATLGYCLEKLPGHAADALAQFQEALREDPDYADAHFNLGNLWAAIPGHLSDAIAQYREAVRSRPDYPQARINLAIGLAQSPGGLGEAEAQIREVLRLHPKNEAAQDLLRRFATAAF